jgi:RNA polymerase sigma-70 factor (ECF subfamily)
MIQQPTPNSTRQPIEPGVEAALTENRHDFLRFLTRRLGSANAAEEVLQQFYLRAVSKASHLRKRESIHAWLYRLLTTVMADYARREAARRSPDTGSTLEPRDLLEAIGWDAPSTREWRWL